jgi:recombination protein RecA
MTDELRDFLARARGTALGAKLLEPDFQSHVDRDATWGLAALRGRLVELSARGAVATLTAAIELVHEAQREGEPVAWIMGPQGSFYPPDVADSGVDLAALVVVRVPELALSSRVAERLLRSSAFGLVVIDISAEPIELPIAHQGRLVTLAQAHDTAVVCLTEKSAETASLGSLISLRAEVMRLRDPNAPEFELTMRVLKDKRRGPGFTRTRKARGPSGL